MSGKPLASIVVITYNNADTIEECLKSLMAQSYPNKEIIIVYDEGSKDGTKQVLERLEASHRGFFKVVSVPHMGRSKARNVGWRSSSGEIVFFADADDIYFRDYLEKAVSKLESDPRMGCVCLTGSSLTTGKGFLAGCMQVYSKLQQVNVEKGGFKPSWAWVYRREALEKAGGFDEFLEQAEDKDLFIRVTAAGYNAGLVTGLNWLHRRPSSLWAHLKKTYLGGIRRILFVAKHGEWRKLTFELLPFWLIIFLLILSILCLPMLVFMLACLTVFVALSIIRVARLVWSRVDRKQYVFLYPVFTIITYLFSATGHMHGLLLFSFKRRGG
ncbi:MAG: glycosyltransferase family 2 protein [Candidatus Brockarchaeota archaeon]|nr:glycosyltransferase family 2 protein [Candidatus Brockarchaeota archaeon]